MENNYLKRLELLKRRAEFFSPFNYGNLLTGLFDKSGVGLPIVAMIFDMQTLLIHRITDNCVDIWGYTKQELEWTDITKHIHPEDLEASVELADKNAIENIPVTKFKNRHFDKAGKVVYLMWETTVSFNMLSLVFCWKITEHQFKT